jgi:hypothetical protein
MTLATVEERLAVLEAEVAALKVQQKGVLKHPTQAGSNWVEKTSGIFENLPDDEWQEFTDACRNVREELNRPAGQE